MALPPPTVTPRFIDAAMHIGRLFPPDDLAPGEHVELRCFKNGRPGPRRFYTDTASAVSAAVKFSSVGLDVFVGVAARRCPQSSDMRRCRCRGRGGKSHIARIRWAFVEIDIGKGGQGYVSVSDILARLEELEIPPTMCVSSGKGVHAYWRLSEPETDVGRFERLTRAMKRELGHDNAIDISRVLRVAGTINNKYDPPRPVRFVRWRPAG